MMSSAITELSELRQAGTSPHMRWCHAQFDHDKLLWLLLVYSMSPTGSSHLDIFTGQKHNMTTIVLMLPWA